MLTASRIGKTLAMPLPLAALLASAAAPAAADTGQELKTLFSLAETPGEQLWPGFGKAPFGFLILEADREVLLCRPTAPNGFQADGTDRATGCPRFVGPRGKLPASMLAAMPLFGPPWTIVMGPAPSDADKRPRWRSTVLHEHMHQWQAELPGYYDRIDALGLSNGDGSGMWMLNFPFPYRDGNVQGYYAQAATALVAAVGARGTPAFARRLDAYLEARRAFAAAAGERNWRYLEFQLWQEGVARWTEIALARRSGDTAMSTDADAHEDAMLDMLRAPDLGGHQRVVVYAYGMAEALLLDACGAAWRESYPAALAMGPILEAAAAGCAAGAAAS